MIRPIFLTVFFSLLSMTLCLLVDGCRYDGSALLLNIVITIAIAIASVVVFVIVVMVLIPLCRQQGLDLFYACFYCCCCCCRCRPGVRLCPCFVLSDACKNSNEKAADHIGQEVPRIKSLKQGGMVRVHRATRCRCGASSVAFFHQPTMEARQALPHKNAKDRKNAYP